MSEHDPSTNVSETEEDRMRLGALQTSEASRTIEAFYRLSRPSASGLDPEGEGRQNV
ncbi:hypothetical protein [Halospeciosus flavus]|uniref:Uncharacterized protein n=1 Tax=Halospeciosus flavus TaxID=3032283 RepID=A0ABD5Z3Q5_9EURY